MNHSSLTSLAKRLDQLADQAEAGMERKVTTAVRVTAKEAIRRTPVDTGEARSSWEVGVNVEPDGQHPPYTPYPALHDKQATYDSERFYETANTEGAMEAVERALTTYKLGDRVVLVNAVVGDEGDHYLRRLEREANYSLQGTRLSPLFWTQIAADIGRKAARKIKVFRRG